MAIWHRTAIWLCMLTGVWIGCGGDGGQNPANPTGTGGTGGAGGDTGTGLGAGGTGGDGGAGGTGGGTCVPGSTIACYTGPAGTQGVGACQAGAQVCNADGAGYGPCEDEITPAPAEDCQTEADDDCSGSPVNGCSQAPWYKRFGDASFQAHMGTVLDAAGNAYLTGFFDGQMDFGGGPLPSAGGFDVFLAKLDAQGNHVWSKRFGDSEQQNAGHLALDSAGNVVVVGGLKGTMDLGGGVLSSAGDFDVFVAKLDAQGNHVWSKRFGDASLQAVHDVAVDSDDNVLVTGLFKGSVDFGGGSLTATGIYDIFVVKLGPQGDHLWSRRFGGQGGAQSGRGIAVDAAGNVALTGVFSDSVDFGGGLLVSEGDYDVFLVKLDPSGNHLWSKRFGNPEPQVGDFVAVDAAGNVIVSGYFRAEIDFGLGSLVYVGDYDIYVAKFDPAGNPIWNKRFGCPQLDVPRGIRVDGAGAIFLSGQFEGDVDFGGGLFKGPGIGEGWDTFALKLDASGNHVWSMQLGDKATSNDRRSIVPDGAGHVVLAGSFGQQVDFGVGSLTGVGLSDIFVAKLVK